MEDNTVRLYQYDNPNVILNSFPANFMNLKVTFMQGSLITLWCPRQTHLMVPPTQSHKKSFLKLITWIRIYLKITKYCEKKGN